MPKLPRISAVRVLYALKRVGFYEYFQSGSHIQLRHKEKAVLRVTVPFHQKDLAPKTLKSIITQAGLTIEEFIELI
jgi:predicted RNA binding protein YcfA (HicA-like mRNA interferase family)